MATGLEGVAVRSVVSALMNAFKKARNSMLKKDAEKQLEEAIRELLLASPDLNKADAAIAAAKAAGIINKNLFLAEKMRSSIEPSKKKMAVKRAAKKPATKKVLKKVAKKTSIKRTAKKASRKRA